jgi:hypothetical protein
MMGLMPAGLVELDGAVHRAVIGQGQSWHAEFGGALGQLLAAVQPIEKRVFTVNVELDEFGH